MYSTFFAAKPRGSEVVFSHLQTYQSFSSVETNEET